MREEVMMWPGSRSLYNWAIFDGFDGNTVDVEAGQKTASNYVDEPLRLAEVRVVCSNPVIRSKEKAQVKG
jgi:hypothetical protein